MFRTIMFKYQDKYQPVLELLFYCNDFKVMSLLKSTTELLLII